MRSVNKTVGNPDRIPFFIRAGLFCFILAGITGFFFRLQFAWPASFQWNPVHLRHAHSHLMFFGWATLMPMYAMLNEVKGNKHSRPGLMSKALGAVLITGLISYAAFLFLGYEPLNGIPVAAVLSSLVMIGWYVFAAGYYRQRKSVESGYRLWVEAALIMLIVSSAGAWGVGISGITGAGNILLTKSLTHFFLAVFTNGWVILVIMFLCIRGINMTEEDYIISPVIIVSMVCLGAPLTFPYGLSESLVNLPLSVSARVGGLLIGQAMLLFVASLISAGKVKNKLWYVPLIFLAIKGGMQLVAAVIPAGFWLADHGIRIFYLHVLLLGALTPAIAYYLVEITVARISHASLRWLALSVILLIMSLIPLTGIWPPEWSGTWIFKMLGVTALLPVLAMSGIWMSLRAGVKEINS